MKKRSTVYRTGFGFDSHAFDRKGSLMLGGVRFDGVPRLKGHSDGDALLHAVIDALLGAAALGDIGDMFPDTSKKLKSISSEKMLRAAMTRLRKSSWSPTHVDVTVLANEPRLAPVKIKMKTKLAKLLGLKAEAVSIKAKTQEGLTLFQSPGGIAVWVVATIVPS